MAKRESAEKICEKLREAVRERDRCVGLLGARLGMFQKVRAQNRIVARLEKRLAARSATIGGE